MKYNKGCMVCGKELIYIQDYRDAECMICHNKFSVNAMCPDAHYVCDSCHNASGNEYIEEYCISTLETNPIVMAQEIMRDFRVNLHGPEHHFLVPAVLITSYFNVLGNQEEKIRNLKIAKKRAEDVKGGMCGHYGSCGAAIGSGIFASVISKATPLTEESWGFANRMTGSILTEMGEIGGPRCCKRNSFLAIIKAAEFFEKEKGIRLFDYDSKKPFCEYKMANKQCIKARCPYFMVTK